MLSGTFDIAPAEPHPPNTVFQFTITSVNFLTPSGLAVRSGHPGPVGCDGELGLGCVNAITIGFPPRVYMYVLVEINGEQVGLGGAGPLEAATGLPVFRDLQVCGAAVDRSVDCEAIQNGTDSGYALTIFAVPEE